MLLNCLNNIITNLAIIVTIHIVKMTLILIGNKDYNSNINNDTLKHNKKYNILIIAILITISKTKRTTIIILIIKIFHRIMTGNKLYVDEGTIDAVYILRMLQVVYWPEEKSFICVL